MGFDPDWPEPYCLFCDAHEPIAHFTIEDAASFLCRRYPINVTAFDEYDREPVGEPLR